MQWNKKAVEKGDAGAMYNVGVYYAEGYGVEKNMDTAITWWKKAAALGNKDAIKALKANGQ
jgi:TPR repeat protein